MWTTKLIITNILQHSRTDSNYGNVKALPLFETLSLLPSSAKTQVLHLPAALTRVVFDH